MNLIIANRLKLLRKEKGLRQLDLAKILNISTSTYGTYETGTVFNLPYITLLLLSEQYNVSIDYILGNSDKKRKADFYVNTDMIDISNNEIMKNINLTYKTIPLTQQDINDIVKLIKMIKKRKE